MSRLLLEWVCCGWTFHLARVAGIEAQGERGAIAVLLCGKTPTFRRDKRERWWHRRCRKCAALAGVTT